MTAEQARRASIILRNLGVSLTCKQWAKEQQAEYFQLAKALKEYAEWKRIAETPREAFDATANSGSRLPS